MGSKSALAANSSEITTAMNASCFLPGGRQEVGGRETPAGRNVSGGGRNSSACCSRPLASIVASRSSCSSVKELLFCMAPFLLLVALEYLWRWSLFALHG